MTTVDAGTPTGADGWPGSGRLRRLLAGPFPPADEADEAARCELCAEPLPAGHRHLADLRSRALRCACRACTLLFDRSAAGGRRYRLVPDRRWYLPDVALDDDTWQALGTPVGMAFFMYDSAAAAVVGFYPSPAGPVRSHPDPAAWQAVRERNPVLDELTPDVEALLVHRRRDGRAHWLVPVDDCYALVGLIRTQWRGMSGGPRVWEAIEEFFTDLRRRARPRAPATAATPGPAQAPYTPKE